VALVRADFLRRLENKMQKINLQQTEKLQKEKRGNSLWCEILAYLSEFNSCIPSADLTSPHPPPPPPSPRPFSPVPSIIRKEVERLMLVQVTPSASIKEWFVRIPAVREEIINCFCGFLNSSLVL
jgi:hypothetical protein